MRSCYEWKPSDSPSQIPTTAVPEQLDRVRESTRIHTPNNTRNITQESVDVSRAMQSSRIQLRADSVQISLEGTPTLGENHTVVVAEGSAVASSSSSSSSSSSRPTYGEETRITPIPHHKGKADGDSTSGSHKQKSPEQLERRRERRRRAQQTRRLMKSEKQDREPTPRVFMQWEKPEVQRLLYKQELTLKSAHQTELQKQKIALKIAHRAELQRQEIALKSIHQAQQAALKARDQKHLEEIRSMLTACKRIMGCIPNRANHTLRGARLLINELNHNLLYPMEYLESGSGLHIYEKAHCELHLRSSYPRQPKPINQRLTMF